MSQTRIHSPQANKGSRRKRGFTLIEVMLAVTILSLLTLAATQVIRLTMRGADIAHERLRRPKVANAIFSQIFRDFRYIYWGGIKGNAGFRAKSNTISGKDADNVQFITARNTRTTALEEGEQRSGEEPPSPLTEVGYALRINDEEPDYLELWRREDAFVDSKPTDGGTYTLVYDRIRSFRLRYFPTPEEAENKEGLETWDSAIRNGIPYAILIKINFDVIPGAEEKVENRKSRESDQGHIYRIIILRGGYNVPFETTTTASTPGR